MARAARIFLPGWGAPGALYSPGLPEGWIALEPPGFGASRGSFEHCRRWLTGELARGESPVVLAGHSMGAALAIAAASELPSSVAGLLLVAPAGLPLTKPILESLREFRRQLARRRYPPRHAAAGIVRALRAPRSAFRLAQGVRALDLSADMERVRAHRIPVTVVGCVTDTLVTARLCREAAARMGAAYRELDLPGGHMWMLDSWRTLRRELAAF